jgi:NDP-sugar pyrophosphorylase family protein
MPIGDMPILEILLRQLQRSGIEEVVLTVGHLAELIRTFFQNGDRLGLKISYSFEDHPLGTAGPLSLVDGLEDTFLVMNGDVLTTLDFCSLVEYHRRQGAIATIAAHDRKTRIDFGVIHTNHNHEIVGYTEKPTYDFFVSMGIYVFEPRVLSYIPQQQYLDVPDLILRMIESGERVLSYPYQGYWMDLGRISDYEQAVNEFDSLRAHLLGERTSQAEISPEQGKITDSI